MVWAQDIKQQNQIPSMELGRLTACMDQIEMGL